MATSRKQLREAFEAGFMSSGEGWNGEYPFEKPERVTPDDLDKLADSWWRWYYRKGVQN